jgi:Protein of unknown function (DUF1176)
MWLKKIILTLSVVFFTSCYASENINNNVLVESKQDNINQNADFNVLNVKNNDHSNQKNTAEISSPFQSNSRRTAIKFPEDCHYFPNESDKNWKLQLACAESLNAVFSKLPKENCDYENNLEKKIWFENYDVEFYSLLINKYLVKIRCTQAAYNESNVYLLYDEAELPAKTEVLEFPSLSFTFDENKHEPKTIENVNVKTVGGRWFNSKTKELTVFVKGRGIGDFGEYARYSFINDRPKLEEFRAEFKSGGKSYNTDDILKTSPVTWKRYYLK